MYIPPFYEFLLACRRGRLAVIDTGNNSQNACFSDTDFGMFYAVGNCFRRKESQGSIMKVLRTILRYIYWKKSILPLQVFFKTKILLRDQKHISQILIQKFFQNSEANIWSCLVCMASLWKNCKILTL